jgi:hypothetical protein
MVKRVSLVARSTRGVAGAERWGARVPCLGREQALRTGMDWCGGLVVWSAAMGTGKHRGSRDRTGAWKGGTWSERVKSDAAGGQRVRERQRPCGEAWPGMMGVPLVSAVPRPRGWFGGKCRLRAGGPPSQLYAEVAERRSDRERVC